MILRYNNFTVDLAVWWFSDSNGFTLHIENITTKMHIHYTSSTVHELDVIRILTTEILRYPYYFTVTWIYNDYSHSGIVCSKYSRHAICSILELLCWITIIVNSEKVNGGSGIIYQKSFNTFIRNFISLMS